MCKLPGTECQNAGQQERKAFFFSEKLQKILISLQNSLFIHKTPFFCLKKAEPRGFLHFRGVLPPCLYTKLAVCAEKCWLLLSFGTSGPSKTKISHALMVYLFYAGIKGEKSSKKYLYMTKYIEKVLAWGQILQKTTYHVRTKCASVQRSFSLLKGAFCLRYGLKCDIIMGVAGGLPQSNRKSTSKWYLNSERTECAGVQLYIEKVLRKCT